MLIEFSFLIFLLMSSLVLYRITLCFPIPEGKIPSPAAFPKYILILLIIFCLVTLINQIKKRTIVKTGAKAPKNVFKVIFIGMLIIAYAVFVTFGYFLYATIAFFISFLIILHGFKQKMPTYLYTIALATITTVILYYLFTKVLWVPL